MTTKQQNSSNRVIKFDLLGQRRLEFDDVGVTYSTNEIYPVPLPGLAAVVHWSNTGRLEYRDVEWIGIVKKRQWWALFLGIVVVALGAMGMVGNWGDWGAFGAVAGFTLLMGIGPLLMFYRGRPFLTIASNSNAISFPADRKKKKVLQAASEIRERCAGI